MSEFTSEFHTGQLSWCQKGNLRQRQCSYKEYLLPWGQKESGKGKWGGIREQREKEEDLTGHLMARSGNIRTSAFFISLVAVPFPWRWELSSPEQQALLWMGEGRGRMLQGRLGWCLGAWGGVCDQHAALKHSESVQRGLVHSGKELALTLGGQQLW